MRFLLFFSFTLIFCTLYGQLSENEQKEINQVLAKEFVKLPNQKSYPYYFNYQGFQVDTSTVYPGDTLTVIKNGEMLMHRDPIAFKKGSEVYKVILDSYVTVEDYAEFQDYIVDSIVRTKLVFMLEDDREASCFLDYEDPYYDKYENRIVEFKPWQREMNWQRFNLNFHKRINYDNPRYTPILADMYIPPFQRFQRQRELDERKFVYRYDTYLELLEDLTYEETFSRFPHLCNWYQLRYQNEEVASYVDHFQWARHSIHPYDQRAVFSQLYKNSFGSIPRTGINGFQAMAYCHWMEDQIQADLNAEYLDYVVKVSLPTLEDQVAVPLENEPLHISLKEYTEQWRITEEQYQEFINAARDSILREFLYQQMEDDEQALKMLNYIDLYFSESRLDYERLSRYNRERNREMFAFNPKYKIKRNHSEIKALIEEFESKKFPTVYRYQWMDAIGKSIVGEFALAKLYPGLHEGQRPYYQLVSRDSLGNPIGMDYAYSWTGNPCTSPGVRMHEDLSRFVKKEVALADVNDKRNVPFMEKLTYEQALAYYHWKYPLFKATQKDNWRNYVYPSEEQFAMIQKGDKVVLPEEKWDYPSAKFRYVVHFYKRN